MPVNLPTNLLRSFVAIVDEGSMLRAAGKVFVTQSALSLQIKRLEDLLQQDLFHRAGRRLSLTRAGDLMLDYARQVLFLHDEAVDILSSRGFGGQARLGMTQDFAEDLLSGLLTQFGQWHPDVKVTSRIADTAELLHQLERRHLDMVLGFGDEHASRPAARLPMGWYGRAALAEQAVVPLVLLEAPCRFRMAATQALEEAGVPYRIMMETPDLASLRGAVKAGLGVTCRIALSMKEPSLEIKRLPTLPQVSCIVRTGVAPDALTDRLARLTREAIGVM